MCSDNGPLCILTCRLDHYTVSLKAASLFLRGRGKAVYILPSSDPTLVLLLVGFNEYDDDDEFFCRTKTNKLCTRVFNDFGCNGKKTDLFV
ncbi:hypothetical protein Hanom_Chr06g00550631 [Helianthus anomalus]